MSPVVQIARQAQRAALEYRRRANVSRDSAICVFDIAEALGVEVKFRPETSLEGMYCKQKPPVILVSAYRPPGRQAFSCAHELGHDVFGHGTRVDEYLADNDGRGGYNPEEQLADFFAAHLLMPIPAVRCAFASRGVDPSTCAATQFYTVAGHLGVGYDTLINHLRWTLGIICAKQANKLRACSPKELRQSLLGVDISGQVISVDRQWVGRAVDVQVGDRIILPFSTCVEGRSIRIERETVSELVVEAVRPGISRVAATDSPWAAFVRVSRHQYVGRSCFRFDEDPDEN